MSQDSNKLTLPSLDNQGLENAHSEDKLPKSGNPLLVKAGPAQGRSKIRNQFAQLWGSLGTDKARIQTKDQGEIDFNDILKDLPDLMDSDDD